MKIRQTIEINSVKGTNRQSYFDIISFENVQKDGKKHNIFWWFSPKPHPNRKNDVYWSPDNPSNIEEVRDQGVSKTMAWVG